MTGEGVLLWSFDYYDLVFLELFKGDESSYTDLSLEEEGRDNTTIVSS